jgi:DNA mismatch endonuclease Vsr
MRPPSRPPKPADPRRSALFARVRQKGTSAELAVAAALRELGFAYRLNVKALPGSPDFANRKRKWAVFVHGCYWHHHTGCKRQSRPRRAGDPGAQAGRVQGGGDLGVRGGAAGAARRPPPKAP